MLQLAGSGLTMNRIHLTYACVKCPPSIGPCPPVSSEYSTRQGIPASEEGAQTHRAAISMTRSCYAPTRDLTSVSLSHYIRGGLKFTARYRAERWGEHACQAVGGVLRVESQTREFPCPLPAPSHPELMWIEHQDAPKRRLGARQATQLGSILRPGLRSTERKVHSRHQSHLVRARLLPRRAPRAPLLARSFKYKRPARISAPPPVARACSSTPCSRIAARRHSTSVPSGSCARRCR